jgi:hypothetical protein
MTTPKEFADLTSDDLYVEASAASDGRGLRRRLMKDPRVQSAARHLASDPDRIAELVEFARDLLIQPHDGTYRHPNDIAVCACLTVLEASPLNCVRQLIHRLKGIEEPSLVWVKRIALLCDSMFTEALQVPHRESTVGAKAKVFDHLDERSNFNQVIWIDPNLSMQHGRTVPMAA